MFAYLITVQPLGMMYGSAGGFLSAENLVGRSRAKFPPDAATFAGLLFSANYQENPTTKERENIRVAGPFWANVDDVYDFYVPLPWVYQISDHHQGSWQLEGGAWEFFPTDPEEPDPEPEYQWMTINGWNNDLETIWDNASVTETPWSFTPILHPHQKTESRTVQAEDGLFLEYAVQMKEETCLVYLSTQPIESGWYRMGGENHLVEVDCHPLTEKDVINERLNDPIDRSFALITPGVWGSNRLSYRYPQKEDFPAVAQMLTDKAIPYRYRLGDRQNAGGDRSGRLSRGRYAVPPGSVYVLEEPLNRTWWDWPDHWFPKEGIFLNRLGCGLALPLSIPGV